MWQTKPIRLYCAVCDNSSIFEREMQRQSNNFRPQFVDEACITVYLWGVGQRRFEQKAIYSNTKNHLQEWFSQLPSYQAFCRRCTNLAPAFRAIGNRWMEMESAGAETRNVYMVDSCPVMLAHRSGSGSGKVARDLRAKRYNSTGNEWYYGVKLHAFNQKEPTRLPHLCALSVSSAENHDPTAAKQMTGEGHFLNLGWLYCDKAYLDEDSKETLERDYAVKMTAPRKKQRGDTLASGMIFPHSSAPCGSS